jgi:hypothetical protein
MFYLKTVLHNPNWSSLIHTYIISYEGKFTTFRSVSLCGGFLTPLTTGNEGRPHVYQHNITILIFTVAPRILI